MSDAPNPEIARLFSAAVSADSDLAIRVPMSQMRLWLFCFGNAAIFRLRERTPE